MAVFNTFTFDGENSLDYGVYITGEAVYNAPERAVEMVSIPGKNGALALDQGRFENIEVTYPAGTFGAEQTEFAGRMRALRNMLASRYNYVRLTDSYHPDEYRLGLYKSGLEASPVAMSSAGEFDITFNCKPQRFLTSGEEPIDTSELGGEVTTNRDPYLFRRSGGGNIGHDFDAEIDKLIGGTVAWNQLYHTHTNYNVESGSVSGVTLAVSNGFLTITGTATANCDVNLLPGTANTPANHVCLILKDGGDGIKWNRLGFNSRATTNSYFINKHTASFSSDALVHIENGVTYNTSVRFSSIDLTALFGSAEIADYIYSLEQTTSGAGVAWLKAHGFLTKDYYAYDSGSLKSVKTSAHVMRDEDDNIIGNYALDSDLELRGIPKLSNGSLYYDGDVYESSGAVTRKYGIVDLGTLNYTYNSGKSLFVSATPFTPMKLGEAGTKINGICTIYDVLNYEWYGAYAGINNILWVHPQGYIVIRDTSKGTSPTAFKTAMSGVYLVYELATSTTEQADPFEKIQTVSPYGTEKYVDERDVPVPVGHETKYGMSQLVLNNPTEFPSKPLLEVTGVGTFWLGDTLFTITGTAGQTIYIDCETGEAWKNVGGTITPANGLVTLNRLDFPELDPGDTPVMYGTGITKVVVTPRWWII